MPVVTRFAPSPTGYLHIGGARTALFNWLFARHHDGKFLLRIEDTDRARSTDAAIAAILKGMEWLGLEADGEPVYQFARAVRHAEVAKGLIASGGGYYCFTSPEELTALREEAQAQGKPFRFNSPWRDAAESEYPEGIKPVLRLKAPREGSVTIKDQVQGDVVIACEQLDDMVLLRSDGTPTYMLAVVVDDHDMGVTHVIRGDDHLTNAARQSLLYQALGWDVPVFAHIPLIHGADGAKLSKRHGALGVEEYEKMGYLPEAMRNYLLRLGWSHGDDEIITGEQAREWFNLESVGKSPARFDFAKLEKLNGHYMRLAENGRLVELIVPLLEEKLGGPVSAVGKQRLLQGMDGLKERAKTIVELAESSLFYVLPSPIALNDKAKALVAGDGAAVLAGMATKLAEVEPFTHHATMEAAKVFAEETGRKLGNVAQPLRAALAGSNISPSVFDMLEVLGKEESLTRLRSV